MSRNATNSDITLIICGNKFIADKRKISEKSDYFKAMFSSGLLECKSNEVAINEISSKGFEDILRYMHGSKLKITRENVFYILEIANYIQINEVIKLCKDFLLVNIDTGNYTNIANIAEFYSFIDLQEHVLNFIVVKFSDIAKTKNFHELRPDQITHTVAADKEVEYSELQLLEAILEWGIKPSYLTIEEKLKHVEGILDHVRFYEIPKKDLNEMLKKISSNHSAIAIHSIHEKIAQLSAQPCNSFRTKFSSRGLKNGFIRVNTRDSSVIFYFDDGTECTKLTNIACNGLANYPFFAFLRIAVVNNELYLFGNHIGDRPNMYRLFAIKFSHKTNDWETIDMIVEKRRWYSLTEVDDKIYMVGGQIKNGNSRKKFCSTNTAKSFDTITKTWKNITSLPQPRYQHASVNFGNTLYISGGLINDSRMVTSMLKYNSITNTWLSCAPLLTPRTRHIMFTYGDKIYACGGRSYVNGRGLSIEEYDVANNSWRFLTNVPGGHLYSRVIIVNSKIYYVKYTSYDIDCYDLVTNEWCKCEEFTEINYFFGIFPGNYDCFASMYLPKSLRDESS